MTQSRLSASSGGLTFYGKFAISCKGPYLARNTKETVSGFPARAKRELGFGLRLVQNGGPPDFAVSLRDMGSEVFELKVDSGKDTFPLVYIAKLPPAIMHS